MRVIQIWWKRALLGAGIIMALAWWWVGTGNTHNYDLATSSAVPGGDPPAVTATVDSSANLTEQERPGSAEAPSNSNKSTSRREFAGGKGQAQIPRKPESQDPPVVAYLSGSVQKPGVYTLPAGARITDLMAAAGGALPHAAIEYLNLALLVPDGSHVHVPTRSEIAANSPQPRGYGWEVNGVQEPLGARSETKGSVSLNGTKNSGSLSIEKINLNTATAEQLQSLNGIGPRLAQRICEYRERSGGFKSVSELAAVNGISPRLINSFADHVTV